MPTDEPKPIEVFSTFSAWDQLAPHEWRGAVWAAVDVNVERVPWVAEARRTFRTVAREQITDQQWRAIDEVTHEVTNASVAAAALMGFALARTWPERIEDLATWTARAWEYANLSDNPTTLKEWQDAHSHAQPMVEVHEPEDGA